MGEIKKISIIGAGCVANAFASEFYRKGFFINEIVSRRITEAEKLAEKVNATARQFGIGEINPESDLYIVSVKDDALTEVRKHIHTNDKLIVHTSGSMPSDALKKCSKNYGIFYPLQTFSKNRMISMQEIPVFVNANTQKSVSDLMNFAKSFSNNVQHITDDKLSIIHLSAVFASNFTNYLIKISKDILYEKNLDYQILKSLVEETMKKAFEMDPFESQTGPAKRGDCNITDKHKEMLVRKDWRALYTLFSGMIREDYSKNKKL